MANRPGRFGELRIEGFRRLRDVTLDLRPLSVMIGANGCGKTSVLQVLWLLAQSAKGRLGDGLSELSGISSVLSRGADSFKAALDLSLATRGFRYDLRIDPSGLGHVVSREHLVQVEGDQGSMHPEGGNWLQLGVTKQGPIYQDPESRKLFRANWRHDSTETVLSQAPQAPEEAEVIRLLLASCTLYHALDVTSRSPVRLPQPLRPADLPGKNGEDLISCLFNMRETARDRFAAVEDSLRVAFPLFERLEFPPVAAGTVAMGWRERGNSRPFYMNELSEGTLRFLWLTSLLQSPGLTALTMLDEPEVSLHPQLLSLLADQLREASHRSQIVVATHSDRLIQFLCPEEVVVIDSDEQGDAVLTRADELDLEGWLRDYTLGELWNNGVLGAKV